MWRPTVAGLDSPGVPQLEDNRTVWLGPLGRLTAGARLGQSEPSYCSFKFSVKQFHWCCCAPVVRLVPGIWTQAIFANAQIKLCVGEAARLLAIIGELVFSVHSRTHPSSTRTQS